MLTKRTLRCSVANFELLAESLQVSQVGKVATKSCRDSVAVEIDIFMEEAYFLLSNDPHQRLFKKKVDEGVLANSSSLLDFVANEFKLEVLFVS